MIDIGRSKKDTVLFNKFLRMPFDYFKFIGTVYSNSLVNVPKNIGALISTYQKLQGKNIYMDTRNRTLLYRGLPPEYTKVAPESYGKKEILDTLKSLSANIEKFSNSGTILYLHSPFETSAIAAGSKLCLSATDQGISWRMSALPAILRLVKDFDGDHSDTLRDIASVKLLCLYMVGKEYPTEFTTSYFKQLVEERKVDKLTTILCSHLSVEEFKERYGKDISICDMGFTDDNELVNYKALRRLVES